MSVSKWLIYSLIWIFDNWWPLRPLHFTVYSCKMDAFGVQTTGHTHLIQMIILEIRDTHFINRKVYTSSMIIEPPKVDC